MDNNFNNQNQQDNKSFKREELEKLFPEVDFSDMDKEEPEFQVAFEPEKKPEIHPPPPAQPPLPPPKIEPLKPLDDNPPPEDTFAQFEKPPKPPKTPLNIPWKLYFKFAGLFLGIFILTFLIINFSALLKITRFTVDVTLRQKTYSKALPTPTPRPTFDAQAEATLIIPKIGVNAPIIWNIEESQIYKRLTDGVVHYKGTALPSQKGNIFITGHSSYYSWSSSPYKDVFALLEKMSVGDKMYISVNGAIFTYQIAETKVVSPKSFEVLNQGPNYSLTLMTCVPVGTTLNRLIVIGDQIPN